MVFRAGKFSVQSTCTTFIIDGDAKLPSDYDEFLQNEDKSILNKNNLDKGRKRATFFGLIWPIRY